MFVDGNLVLAEGAAVERIRRSGRALLDPDILHAGLVYSEAGGHFLAALHRQYLDIGRRYGLPLLVLTDTWHPKSRSVA